MTEYKVIETKYHPDLTRRVNDLTKEGWRMMGNGVQFNGNYFCTIVKVTND